MDVNSSAAQPLERNLLENPIKMEIKEEPEYYDAPYEIEIKNEFESNEAIYNNKSTMETIIFKNKRLNSQSKSMLYNVIKYVKEMKMSLANSEGIDMNVNFEVSKATGVNESTIKKFIQRINKADNLDDVMKSPSKKKQKRTPRILVDNFMEGVIRRKISDFYVIRKEIPTLKKLNKVLKDDGILQCGETYLGSYLRKMGYTWRKIQSYRVVLMENYDVVFKRQNYLRELKAHRDAGRSIIYVDESYVNTSNAISRCWQSPEELVKKTAGQRLIIVHAGGSEGLVHGSLLIFKSKSKTGDYLDDINSHNFEKWTEKMLIPNLPPQSIIVVNNASYHNGELDKKPPKSALKKTMIEWLSSNNVPCNSTMLNSELYSLIQSVNVEKRLVIDEILKAHGHKVLRLPPYHADLNPIEFVWGEIKGMLVRDHVGTNLNEKCERLKTLIQNFGKEMWRNCIEHVIKIEEEYISKDFIFDNNYDEIFEGLEFGASDTSCTESDTDGDSSDD